MTRRRWIADEFSQAIALPSRARMPAHLSRTLRARVGQQFEVACGDQVRLATVCAVQDERVEFMLGEESRGPRGGPHHTTAGRLQVRSHGVGNREVH